MTETSKEIFFSTLKAKEAKGNDIMPSIIGQTYPYTSEWKNQRTREVFGQSIGQGTGKQDKYFLA